jgi:CBS domain-containing protein
MATVKDLLREKGTMTWTIPSTATIQEALKLMSQQHIGALPVTDLDQVVGIFSERDYARHVALTNELSLNLKVSDLMVHPVFIVHPDQDVEECMNVMTAKKFRHLPVMENHQLIGIISIGDVVKHLLGEKNLVIDNLHYYIAGRSNPR